MLDHTAPEPPGTTVQNESAAGPGRPVSETEERFFESADIDEDSCLSEAESYVVSLDPADSAGADLAGIHRAPRSNSLEAESAFPEDAHSAPEIGFDDPEALDRMVRFARHKRGRLLPALRKAALYVLWGSAIVVALAAALFLAGRLAQEYLP
jgi:hypothetical protein